MNGNQTENDVDKAVTDNRPGEPEASCHIIKNVIKGEGTMEGEEHTNKEGTTSTANATKEADNIATSGGQKREEKSSDDEKEKVDDKQKAYEKKKTKKAGNGGVKKKAGEERKDGAKNKADKQRRGEKKADIETKVDAQRKADKESREDAKKKMNDEGNDDCKFVLANEWRNKDDAALKADEVTKEDEQMKADEKRIEVEQKDDEKEADENQINEDLAGNQDGIDEPADGDSIGELQGDVVEFGRDNEGENEMIGWEWALVFMTDVVIAKTTAFRNYLRQHPLPRPRLPRVAWRRRWDTLRDNGRLLWQRYSTTFLNMLKWTVGVFLVVILARLAFLIFGLEDKVQTFEEFVQQKDNAYSRVVDVQNDYVEELLEAQANLKDTIEAVEKASTNQSDHHSGELAKIQTSIIEVKDEFQRFMVESQIHMMEVQEQSNKNQKEMAGMQKDMNREMGSIRDEVQDARRHFDQMKSSLHSIEYNIQNLKNCGFLSRLFGLCH